MRVKLICALVGAHHEVDKAPRGQVAPDIIQKNSKIPCKISIVINNRFFRGDERFPYRFTFCWNLFWNFVGYEHRHF